MARPPKNGLDYFPFNTDFESDPKIKQLIIQCGKDGVLVYLWSLLIIYHEGYYTTTDAIIKSITWDFRDIDENRIIEILSKMAEIDLIDKRLFVENIITSTGIQRRCIPVFKKRTNVDYRYWLLDEFPTQKSNTTCISDAEIGVSDAEIGISDAEMQHSTEEKRTVREENRREKESVDFQLSLIDDLRSVGVSIEENTKRWIIEIIKEYDRRSIREAFDMAIEKRQSGEIKSVVGYINGILRKWANGEGSPAWVKEQESELENEKLQFD